jgi:hypothetical protein
MGTDLACDGGVPLRIDESGRNGKACQALVKRFESRRLAQ